MAALVRVRRHARRWPGTAGRRVPGFNFATAALEALERAERGEKTERELLREALAARDASGAWAASLDTWAAGAPDSAIRELRAAVVAAVDPTGGGRS